MHIPIANHPLITHRLTVLRDKNAPSHVSRQRVEELLSLRAYEATREVKTTKVTIETPVTTTHGLKHYRPRPFVMPILRAGFRMLEGMVKLLPTAEVDFLVIKKYEETLQPYAYANHLANDLAGRQVYIIYSIDCVFEKGATDGACICLLGASESVAAVEQHLGDRHVKIVPAAIDEKLSELGYIVPGLGDAGDRLYGLAD